jgi:hypothetical protein
MKDVEEGRSLPVPEHLKNKHLKVAEGGGEEKAYLYPHDFKGHYVEQVYVPTSAVYYEPAPCGYELTIGQRMAGKTQGAETGKSESCNGFHERGCQNGEKGHPVRDARAAQGDGCGLDRVGKRGDRPARGRTGRLSGVAGGVPFRGAAR